MRNLSPERKLRYLSEYISAFVDSWPKKIKPFDSWVDSIIDTKINQGKKDYNDKLKKICHYCRREFVDNVNEKTRDHIIPVSKGGLNVKENRVPCCNDCNQWKRDKTLMDWLKEIVKCIKTEKNLRGYELHTLGLMAGNIKHLIGYVKKNIRKISIYKV